MLAVTGGATPHQEEAAPLDMHCIRRLRSDTYAVRVTIRGVQEHVGTYRSRDEAIAARDERLTGRAPKSAWNHRPKKRPLECPEQLKPPESPAKAQGVYERQTATGPVYDVIAYCQGIYCWGGRYRTQQAAVEARTKLTLTAAQVTAARAVGSERGITVRFNKGRGALGNQLVPVYIARVYRKGAKHLGTFKTLEAARAAIAGYRPIASS